MKRFTETTKWGDPWFRELSAEAKMLWLYLCDHCDAAGVVEISTKMASVDCGLKITQEHLAEISSRISQVGRKIWIKGFIRFQYGKLSRDCKPHMPVFASLEKYGIDHTRVDQNDNYTNTVSPELRQKIILRDESTCAYTGRKLYDWEIAIDHIVPRSKGGTCDPSNLVVMEAGLNGKKWDLSVQDFCLAQGFDFTAISERLSKATMKGFQSLQDQDQEKDKDQEKVKSGGMQGGKPPDIEAVKLHAAKIGLPEAEASKFHAYYESNGWRVGKNPMRSWSAAMTTWRMNYEGRRFDGNGSGKPKPLPESNQMQETIEVRTL